ncbi:histidine kinase N-terminal 7TM domain-containing protein [Bdellovibrio sp. ArHS]|uniref:sensor histidine kinase n=1 Tax=Bdellovibrio sp. ArHS TaxID=1569284 RepID=UPI0025C3166D|nr:histidine kinase N-terminal 7TM domain-containing protein [Bdellovibrio sp. ArHS]
MGVSTLLILLHVLIFFVSVIVIAFIFPIRRWSLVKWLIVLLSSFCLVSFFCLSIFAHHEYDLKVLFSRLRFVGLAILAPSWLLFLSSNFQKWKWLRRREVIILLYAPALVTAICAVWPAFQDLILTDFAPIQVFGLSVLKYKAGVWYPVHYLWSVLLLVASFALEAQVFIQGNSTQRKQVSFLFLGSLISLTTDVYCVLTDSPFRWTMLPAGSYLFTALAVAYGVFRQRLFASMLIDVEKVYLQLPDPVVILNNEGKIIGYNHSAKIHLHLSDAAIDNSITKVLPGVPQNNGDFQFLSEARTSRFFELTHKEFGTAMETAGRVLFFRDVTERKAAEQRLQEDAEFRSLLMNLIAHDMYGHIQSQTRLLEILKKDIGSNGKEVANILTTSSLASRDLIQGLLMWSKTQDSHFQPQLQPFEVCVFIEDVIAELSSLFQEKNVHIRTQAPTCPLIANGDSQMLGTVVRNLLTNALRASGSGQEVRINVFKDENNLRIDVEDEGVGMSHEDIVRLMERGKNRTFKNSSGDGFGIGFKLVMYFMDLHSGHVQVHSQPGKGTQVRLLLPL